MSMRHSREGTTLTVTGLVRNPAGGAEARRVTAVVFAFDRNGGFTASGRAPLDFVVLEPGDESPFVVTIPNVTEVAKYRVSFRTERWHDAPRRSARGTVCSSRPIVMSQEGSAMRTLVSTL